MEIFIEINIQEYNMFFSIDLAEEFFLVTIDEE